MDINEAIEDFKIAKKQDPAVCEISYTVEKIEWEGIFLKATIVIEVIPEDEGELDDV